MSPTPLNVLLDEAVDSLRGTCPVGIALDTWGAWSANWLTDALADPGVPSAAVAAATREVTPRLSAQAVQAHRVGDCPCIIGEGAP